MSAAAAAIGGLVDQGVQLTVGAPAHLVLVDPAARRVVDPARMATAGTNNPFRGRELPGRVVATFYRGTPTVLDGALAEPAPDRSDDRAEVPA
jgi:dihydroorotase